MKKTLSLLGMIFILSAILTLSCLATEGTKTFVAEGSCLDQENVFWTIFSNEQNEYIMEISGSGAFCIRDKKDNEDWTDAMPWKEHIPNLTKVVVGNGITHISGHSFYKNTAITTVVLGNDVVSLGNSAFAGCNALKTIYRGTEGPEGQEGTFDLTGITYFGECVFDGCKYVENIILPEDGSYSLNAEFLKSNRNLKSISIPAACASISPLAFRDCSALENVYIEGDTDIIAGYITRGGEKFFAYAFHNCGKDGSFSISAKTGTPAHNYANKYKESCAISYIPPCDVEIIHGDEYLETVQVVEAFKMSPIYDREYVSYIIFSDKECTKLISDTVITENTTVYAKPLFEFIGYMVRIADHHGLRAIFEYDRSVFKNLEGFTVKEVGVLGGKKMGIEPTLTLDSKDTDKMVIWKDDVFVGKLIEYPKDDKITFASTAVGYEKGGEIVPSRVANTILSRAYVTVEYNGATVTFYSSQSEKDLTSACRATLEAEESENLDESAITFLQELIALGIDVKDDIYSKDEALAHLTAIYNDPDHILSGQHIGPGKYTVRNSLDKIYAATGEMPAVLSYDVSVAYRDLGESYETNIGFVADDFAEYAKQGGLITMCAHMTNPDPDYTESVYGGKLSKAQWDQLLLPNNTTGNEIYNNFITELEAIADFLQLLEDRGVTVFWRPYHEANIKSFWFCGTNIPKCDCNDNPECIHEDICEHGDEEISVCYFKQLWEMTYEYLVDKKGLNNLIWVYSPNMAKETKYTSDIDVMKYYPGNEHVDVMGLDVYHDNNEVPKLMQDDYIDNWSKLAKTEKPVVYGEFGPSGKLIHCDPKLSYNGEDALNFVTRVEGEESNRHMGWVVFWRSQSDKWMSLDLMDKAYVFMQADFVLDLDEARTIILDKHYNSPQE